jgi:hypothetical protein
MLLILLLALALTPLAFLIRKRRVAHERLLVAQGAELAARALAEQMTNATRDALATGMLTESNPPTGPEPSVVREELVTLQVEVQRLRRRVAELEARVPAFPNPDPSQSVGAEGGLTLPDKPD